MQPWQLTRWAIAHAVVSEGRHATYAHRDQRGGHATEHSRSPALRRFRPRVARALRKDWPAARHPPTPCLRVQGDSDTPKWEPSHHRPSQWGEFGVRRFMDMVRTPRGCPGMSWTSRENFGSENGDPVEHSR